MVSQWWSNGVVKDDFDLGIYDYRDFDLGRGADTHERELGKKND